MLALLMALLLLVAGLALVLPASMLAGPVSTISNGQVKLTLASGRLIAGRGELWIRDAADREQRSWRPWMPFTWTLNFQLRNQEVAAPALVLDTNAGAVTFSRSGLVLSGVKFALPPSLLLSGVNHPLANAPWRGDVQLSARRFTCSWDGLLAPVPRCDGQALVRWRGAGSALLPLPEFGDYLVSIAAQSAEPGRWQADITTESGVVRVDGSVNAAGRQRHFKLDIKSNQGMIAGLEGVAGPSFRRKGPSGEFTLEGDW